jgi:hypothetical protein
VVAFEVGEIELVDTLFCVGEVGVDLETVEIGDDEKRRIEEVFAVVVELFVSSFEIFVRTFVLPCEMIAEPDVGEAFTAVYLGDGLFER